MYPSCLGLPDPHLSRINSNPLLISAQKQMLLVEEVKKKKKEVKVGEDTPDWQSVSTAGGLAGGLAGLLGDHW